jgi:hypothetical protein
VAQGAIDEMLGDADLMLRHGLEVPYSLAVRGELTYDHHHGAGVSHGHGHDAQHGRKQHE